MFEESTLIFVRQQDGLGWYRTFDCLWSSATSIRGKVTLGESYEELEDFFVRGLGVKSLTLVNGNVEVDAIFALTSIFASNKLVLGEILDDQGIIQIPFDNDDESESWPVGDDEGNMEADVDIDRAPETDQSSRQEFTPTNSSETDALSQDIASPILAYNTDLSEAVVETVSQRSHISHQGRSAAGRGSSELATAFHPSRSDNYSSPQVPRNWSSGSGTAERGFQEDVQYRLILVRVVEAARKANFPSGGVFDMQGLRDTLSGGNVGMYESFDGLDVMNKFRSSSQQERDKRIGAAGELYVSEPVSMASCEILTLNSLGL